MSDHRIVPLDEWNTARDELLVLEKEHTRRGDDLARLRHGLPWVRIEKDYTFQTADGPRSLAALFEGRSQLAIYSFMFGPDYEAGCPVCSSIADSFNGVIEHLKARDVTMICVSRAPIDKLLGYRRRMGWDFPWASSFETDFNVDFDRYVPPETVATWFEDERSVSSLTTSAEYWSLGSLSTVRLSEPDQHRVADPPAIPAQFAADCGTDPITYLTERPGLTAFTLVDGEVYLTYSSTARGLETVMVYYGILDRVSKGRDEGDPANPSWIRRHDEFATAF
jgi:predicted dithiol-disulfide oxidoreductase (DUF899 family)